MQHFRIRAVVASTAMALIVAPLSASTDVVSARKAGFRELGSAFKGVNDSIRSGEVQSVALGKYAEQIRKASNGIYRWFPKGSGPKAGVKTAALAGIWAKPAAFKKAQDGLATATTAFEKAVKSKNLDSIRTATRNLGGTCKACHDSFKAKDD
ncbi:MAG: hypothetical protein RL481_1180 [Pseudomonadota bacterium]|jgi:cytochrome c556